MFNLPEFGTPEVEAYFVGFALPFIAAALGFAVGAVRNMLRRVNEA